MLCQWYSQFQPRGRTEVKATSNVVSFELCISPALLLISGLEHGSEPPTFDAQVNPPAMMAVPYPWQGIDVAGLKAEETIFSLPSSRVPTPSQDTFAALWSRDPTPISEAFKDVIELGNHSKQALP